MFDAPRPPETARRARLLELAETVERSETFDLSVTFHPCGTPGCIAGHANALRFGDMAPAALPTHVIAWLSLSYDEYDELCNPANDHADHRAWPGEPGWVTPARAGAVLRHFAATGEIDWTVGEQDRTEGRDR